MAKAALTQRELKDKLLNVLNDKYGVTPDAASNQQIYEALASIIVTILREKRKNFTNKVHSEGRKQVYYLSMEFLMGRSLKTSLFNLKLTDAADKILKEYGITLDSIYEAEPDAGLGNGGLGRLAACYLDGLATDGYSATGYSILYELGFFKQKLQDGWQNELPDNWLPGGKIWLVERPEQAIEVHIGGEAREKWENNYHIVTYDKYTTISAVPYDLFVSGYDSEAVSKLRLWKPVNPIHDNTPFITGDIASLDAAARKSYEVDAIGKVLYPNDQKEMGQELRVKQQYFLCSASINDIVNHHMATYGTLENLADKVAIQINDTHPTMAIPELMRILLDDCGYSWDKAWDITTGVFAYTNHTVLPEALEKWDISIVQKIAPRIYSIIVEINNRYCGEIWEKTHSTDLCNQMTIIDGGKVHMARLCACASMKINGVSAIHSEIIKESVFRNEYQNTPEKFTNVTNGIAYRRWLCQSNKPLCELLDEKIGTGYRKDATKLKKLEAFRNDPDTLKKLAAAKLENKKSFAKYVKQQCGKVIDEDTLFDVQVKRLHEYKRQHLNVMNIVADYLTLKDDPSANILPRTYIFAAKAAPSYYFAKQVIKLIWSISKELDKPENKSIREKLNVVFLENYSVTLSEKLMPAAEISEQISLAGTEASGTGNMKLMLNGAVTLGTRDGANIEIGAAAGEDNIVFFGMTAEEVKHRERSYSPIKIYDSDAEVKAVIDQIEKGFNGNDFADIARDFFKGKDQYMALADYRSYRDAQAKVSELYRNVEKWQSMSLMNIAGAGVFSADRAVDEYAKNIWGLRK